MARSVSEIKKVMTTAFMNNADIAEKYEFQTGDEFTNVFSVVSLENIIFGIVALVIWTLENIFDIHKKDVNELVETKKPHTNRWYASKALAFQFGFSLMPDSDIYSTIDEASKIVSYASAKELFPYLYIKVAKQSADSLAPLTTPELQSFTEYMERVKDAGVSLKIISYDADYLKLNMQIYYNPMVLDFYGQRLDGTNNTPVQNAVKTYLQSLPFDGEFSIMALTDALQKIEGVEVIQILNVETKFQDNNWIKIIAKYNATSGWFKVYNESDLVIEWRANNVSD